MAEETKSSGGYLHTKVMVGRDAEQAGRPVFVEAGEPASALSKHLTKEQVQELRDAGVVRDEKYEEVGPNDTVPQAASLNERENGTDEPRSVSMR